MPRARNKRFAVKKFNWPSYSKFWHFDVDQLRCEPKWSCVDSVYGEIISTLSQCRLNQFLRCLNAGDSNGRAISMSIPSRGDSLRQIPFSHGTFLRYNGARERWNVQFTDLLSYWLSLRVIRGTDSSGKQFFDIGFIFYIFVNKYLDDRSGEQY